MRNRCSGLILALIVSMMGFAPATALGLSRAAERANLLSLATRAENSSLRYVHLTYAPGSFRFSSVPVSSLVEVPGTADSTASIEVLRPVLGYSTSSSDLLADRLAIPGSTLPNVVAVQSASRPSPGTTRRVASVAYATALALSNGTLNPSRVGVSREEALRRTVAWTNGLAIGHARHEWGLGWQSALWTYYMGAGAKQVWSSVPTCTQELVTQAVTQEADRLLQIPPPFYKDQRGRVVYRGDTKGEENAWNAALLMLAARQFSSNPHAAAWEAQYRNYALTSYASPNQVGRDPRLKGSNINMDGTVVNHGIIHPDYMASYAEMLVKYQLVASSTGTPVPYEGLHNFRTVWGGLTRTYFSPRRYQSPGGTIFRYNTKGAPTPGVYYPQGTDWSTKRRFNLAETCVEVWAQQFDNRRSYGFAAADLQYTIWQQNRFGDGHIFAKGETRFTEEEQFAAASLAEIASRLQNAQ